MRHPFRARLSALLFTAALLAGFCVSYAAGMQEQARTRPRARPLCDGGAGRGTLYLSERAALPAQAPGGGGARCAAANPARQRPLAAGIGRACV